MKNHPLRYRSRNSASWKKLLLLTKLLILSMLLFFSTPRIIVAEELIAHEYQIKAAFLYNFANFIAWPISVFPSPSSNFNICVLGQDPFGEQIDSITQKTIGTHKIMLSRIKTIDELQKSGGCQILFIAPSEKDNIPNLLLKIGDKPILTVSEQENACQLGVMITMTVLDERVRFQINRKAASRAGIQISSKLLRLATTVLE